MEPVLEMDEASNHPHNVHRGVFNEDQSGGVEISKKTSMCMNLRTDVTGLINCFFVESLYSSERFKVCCMYNVGIVLFYEVM